jgi:hypothetical protein
LPGYLGPKVSKRLWIEAGPGHVNALDKPAMGESAAVAQDSRGSMGNDESGEVLEAGEVSVEHIERVIG